MVQVGDGPFINLARLNVAKYAGQQNIAKALFEYIYFHENDVRHVSVMDHTNTSIECYANFFFFSSALIISSSNAYSITTPDFIQEYKHNCNTLFL